MNNEKFLDVLGEAFITYINTGSRSNKKLVILHGNIAKDLSEKLGNNYKVEALGFEEGKERVIAGRYMDKRVDISVTKGNKVLAGIALKFIMQNYSQNSVNYFENMLGETANMRTKDIPYFQILIIPKKIPYFKNGGIIEKVETVSRHNIDKYIKLSEDDSEIYYHTPTKTLLYIVNVPEFDPDEILTKSQYNNYYNSKKNIEVTLSSDNYDFKDIIIYNDYEKFISKLIHYIKYKE